VTVSADPTGFLYPFIEAEETDAAALVAELAASAEAKIGQSRALRSATLEGGHEALARAGRDMAERLRSGGRLLCFGNGGSATDAEAMVALFRDPPRGRPLAALSLADDSAVLTALANDVGFDVAFSRQIIAFGRPEDVAVGFSTSGDSVNVLQALEEAAGRNLLTVGLSGYEGGAMAVSDAVSHCLVVRSDSVHRIQEAQSALVWQLWSTVQRRMDERIEA
jgi:D-sedoheptulose 7-phosphate isomerase